MTEPHPAEALPDCGDAAGESPQRSPARGWALAAVSAIAGLIAYEIQYELLPFIIAAAIGFVLDPLINRLQPRMGHGRWLPATSLFILLLLAGVAFSYWIGGVIVAQTGEFANDGPRMMHELIRQAVGPGGLSLFGKTYTAASLTQELQDRATSLLGAGGYAKAAEIGIGAILGMFLTLVLTFYFLLSGPRIAAGVIWLLPPERRGSVRRVLPSVVPALRRYLVGVAVVVTFTAIAGYLGFGLLFHLPHAILLSIAVGVLETIPALGPFTSMVLVGLSAFQEHSVGTAAWLMAYAVFLRLAIDNGIGPLVLGQSARLHPVAVMFAFICGAALFGVAGLLLAVPSATCLVIVLNHYYAKPLSSE